MVKWKEIYCISTKSFSPLMGPNAASRARAVKSLPEYPSVCLKDKTRQTMRQRSKNKGKKCFNDGEGDWIIVGKLKVSSLYSSMDWHWDVSSPIESNTHWSRANKEIPGLVYPCCKYYSFCGPLLPGERLHLRWA